MARTIDLHIHTNCSDGAYSPKEIIDIAKKNNVFAIAISDHDTVEAYNKELIAYAKVNEIKLIPAVEMSTRYKGTGFHVLGYNIDINNEELLKCLSMLKNARLDYLNNVAVALSKLGYKLNVEKLKQLPTVTKAHISEDIITNENNAKLLIKDFGHIPNKGEFIETIMNEGCPAFVEKFSITPIEASRIIKGAKGKVVLAHPVAYTHEDKIEIASIESLLQEMNADGLESNYIYADKYNKIFDETAFWNKFAKSHNLFTTIGSDFHNIDGVHPELGFRNMTFEISEDEANQILKNINN